MASTSELLSAGIFLVANTLVIAVCSVVGGPIFGSLTSFVSSFSYAANSPLKPQIVQWIPGFFFTLLLILEIVLIIRLAYVVVSKTNYQGEQEW
jgi:Ca2+/Na+ antiporter